MNDSISTLDTGHYQLVGDTDSERAFLHLVHNAFTPEGVQPELLMEATQRINALGEFNYLLASGPDLYAYHCRTGYKGLYWLERVPPHSRTRLIDEDFEFDFSAPIYKDEQGFIIASTPLTDEPWEPFQPGELRVFYRGQNAAQYQL